MVWFVITLKFVEQVFGLCIATWKSTPAGGWRWPGLSWMESVLIKSYLLLHRIFPNVEFDTQQVALLFLLCFLFFCFFFLHRPEWVSVWWLPFIDSNSIPTLPNKRGIFYMHRFVILIELFNERIIYQHSNFLLIGCL